MPKPPPFPSAGRGPHLSHAQLLERAAFALQVGRFAEAERLAADILRASRTNTAAVTILARALLAQNRGAEAIAPLEKAARRDSDAGIETLLGAALDGAGRRDEAIERLRQAVTRRPPFLPAFQELAGQLRKAGGLDAAVATIENGLALMPRSVDLKLDLARLLIHRNDRDRARTLLRTALDAAPERFDILTTLARLLLLEGSYTEAADLYRRALAIRPDDVLTRADFSACLLEMGDRDSGEANLRLALRGRPQMVGRTTYALVQSSHGRFFFRPSEVAKFLGERQA